MTPADRDAQLQRIEDSLDRIWNLLVSGELPQISNLSKKGSQKRVTMIDDQFCSQMQVEFGDLLGGPDEVQRQIELALAHKASTKYHDKQTYVRNWLKKAVEYQQARAPGGNGNYEDRQVAEQARHTAGLGRRQIGRDG
jgi:hypothetical protein